MATVHGDNLIFQSCRTVIDAQMDAMKTAMDTAVDDPRPSAIYNTHEVVKMSLPAISVDLDSVEKDESELARKTGAGGEVVTKYHVTLEIRAHTAFENGSHDKVKIARLLNSVNNWLETHRDITTLDTSNVNYLIMKFLKPGPEKSLEKELFIGRIS